MKILNLSVYTWANGGPAHVIHDNTKIQLSMGHEVDIVSPYNEGDEFYIVPAGANLISIKAHWLSKIYPDFSFKIYHFLRKNLQYYDAVHIHGLWNFPGLIALLSANKKIAKIVTIHGTITEGAMSKGNFKKMFFWWLIQKNALKKADFIQIHNKTEQKDLNNLFGKFKHKNIQLITNGLDFNSFKNLPERGSFRKKLGISEEKKIILFFGRLNPIKGIDILMPAFLEVSKLYDNAILLFAGSDSGMLNFINNFVEINNLKEKVIICGMVTGSKKYEVLVDSDIFTLPSYSESFSIAVLEACAAGLPVVVSSEIGFSYEIDQSKIGLLIAFNSQSLANGLAEMLSDDSLRKSSGINGRNMVESKYDLKIVTTNLVKEIENVVLYKSRKQ